MNNKRKYCLSVLFAALLSLTGCSENSTNNNNTTAPVETVADAGQDQSLALGTLATLDASQSTGANLSYSWNLVASPGASTAVLANETSEQASFTADIMGSYAFELTLTDGNGDIQRDDVNISVWQNTGQVDLDFGTDGVVRNFDENVSSANAIALDTEDSLFIVSRYNSDIALLKYKSDGSLDLNFGNNGLATYTNSTMLNGYLRAEELALDSKGNIYLTGYEDSLTNEYDLVVWKFTPTGQIDTTFANEGVFVLDSVSEADSNKQDRGESIIVDKEDNIYVTGTSDTNSYSDDLFVLKLTSNGVLDTTFANKGVIAMHNIAGGDKSDKGKELTLDALGNLYVVGYSTNASSIVNMIILKYLPNGLLDNTFGNGGVVVDPQNVVSRGQTICVDSEGNVFVSGNAGEDMVVLKYTSAGILDENFAIQGRIVETDLAGGSKSNYSNSLKLDSAGNIYISGYGWGNNGNFAAVMLKYTSSGVRDTAFGTDGILVQDDAYGGTGHDFARDGVLAENGDWFITGTTKDNMGDIRLTIWKFQ